MLANVIMREIKHNILSLRLHIAFLLSIVVFGFGTIAFITNQPNKMEEYKRYHTQLMDSMREAAESNLTALAIDAKQIIMEPRQNAFIDDAKEKYTPNRFWVSAYYTWGYDVKPGSANPYLNSFQELNWAFIVALIISFTVLLFTFDSISGEKQDKTLAVSLANSIPRGTLLFGKYLSAIFTSLLILLPGICLSLLIILLSGTVAVTIGTMTEIFGFLLIIGLFTACIGAIGLLSSVLTQSPRTSLLTAISFWLIFIIFIPNIAVFFSETIFPIEKFNSIEQRIQREQEDINNNAPPGSWSSSGGNPFLPEHELRAANQTNLMNARQHILHAYFNQRFNQFERVRWLTFISPISLFEYMSEAVVGGGYLRFKKMWNDVNIYQEQFLRFFKEKDANDPDSPHWYNPVEDYSTTRKPVSFEEVPIFNEKALSLAERFKYGGFYFLILALYTAVIFFVAFMRFVKYDVR